MKTIKQIRIISHLELLPNLNSLPHKLMGKEVVLHEPVLNELQLRAHRHEELVLLLLLSFAHAPGILTDHCSQSLKELVLSAQLTSRGK